MFCGLCRICRATHTQTYADIPTSKAQELTVMHLSAGQHQHQIDRKLKSE